MGKHTLVLYPNQLYEQAQLPNDVDHVVFVEEPLFFGTDEKYHHCVHKQKLIFMRAAMRSYIENVLWNGGYDVDYVEFHHLKTSGDVVNYLSGSERITFMDPTDDILSRRLQDAVNGLSHQPQLVREDSPNFMLGRTELENFFNKKSKSSFKDFYQWQRERFNILIDPKTYKPALGVAYVIRAEFA